MNTLEAISNNPVLTDEVKQQLLGAVCTRGKHKGYLLSNPPSPSKKPGAWLAWQVLVSNIAPARVSPFSLILHDRSGAYVLLDKAATSAGLRFALNTCEPAYRWNLWAHNNDQIAGQEELGILYDEYRRNHEH